MNAKRIEKWIWVLVYGGLAALGLGLAVQRSDDSLGWVIAAAGAALIVAGALLVWARSRMNVDTSQPKKTTP